MVRWLVWCNDMGVDIHHASLILAASAASAVRQWAEIGGAGSVVSVARWDDYHELMLDISHHEMMINLLRGNRDVGYGELTVSGPPRGLKITEVIVPGVVGAGQ